MSLTSTGIAFDHFEAGDDASPQVVLLHAGVADRRMWDAQVAALRGEMGITRMDLRGFGESVSPARGDWSHASDVVGVLDEIGLRRAHLVGSSFGAGVAAELALTRPDRVVSLVVAPPGGSLLATLTDDLAAFVAAEETALEAGDLDAAVEANVVAWVVGKGRPMDDVAEPVLDAVRVMQRRAFVAAGLIGGHEPSQMDPEPHGRAAEFTVPVLIVVGGHDLDTVQDSADLLARTVPDVERQDWPDAAHLVTLEHADRFTRVLRAWTSDHTFDQAEPDQPIEP